MFLVLLFLAACTGLWAKTSTQTGQTLPSSAPAPLTPQHKEWLEDVGPIISDYERNAFLSLKNFTDREQFIEAFWEDRDPTPGTKRNEYKEEFDARLKYVKENFNREGPNPLKTDRGRVWMLLGKPNFRKRMPAEEGMVPVDFWQYTGVKVFGLPESFYLIFFMKNGIGAYRIYSPANDGPQALLNSTYGLESGNNQPNGPLKKGATASDDIYYNYLKTIDPELADATFSLIPTEGSTGPTFNDAGIVSSEFVIDKVEAGRNYQADKRDYVERIIEGRPKVDVYYSLGPQDVKNDLYWFQAPNGEFFVDYAVQFAADKFNMGQYEDEIYTSLTVETSIQTAKSNITVETVNNNHEIKLTKDQFDKIQYAPFQYQGRRMIIPGDYKMSVLIHNNISKSMVPVVEDLDVPDFDVAKAPFFSKLLLIQSSEKLPVLGNGVKPFQFGDRVLEPLVDHRYLVKDEVSFFYQLFFPKASLSLPLKDLTVEYDVVQSGQTIAHSEFPLSDKYKRDNLVEGTISLLDKIQLPDANNGPAHLVARLKNAGKLVVESPAAEFRFDPQKPALPWRYVSGIPDFDSPYHKYVLAQQYLRINETDKAASLLEDVASESPGNLDARLQLMRLELKSKQYDKVLQIAHDLEIQYPKNKDLLWLLGWTYYGMNRYDDAVRFFERGRIEEPNNVRILNTLADVYARLAKYDKSMEMIQKSLLLDPNQPDMLEMKEKVQKQNSGTNPGQP